MLLSQEPEVMGLLRLMVSRSRAGIGAPFSRRGSKN
jgi:hypothetical protein